MNELESKFKEGDVVQLDMISFNWHSSNIGLINGFFGEVGKVREVNSIKKFTVFSDSELFIDKSFIYLVYLKDDTFVSLEEKDLRKASKEEAFLFYTKGYNFLKKAGEQDGLNTD